MGLYGGIKNGINVVLCVLFCKLLYSPIGLYMSTLKDYIGCFWLIILDSMASYIP